MLTSGQECGLVSISLGSADLCFKSVVFFIFNFAVLTCLQVCGLVKPRFAVFTTLFKSVVLVQFKPRFAVLLFKSVVVF